MQAGMPKQQLLEQLRQEHARWTAILAEIDPARMEQPGVTDEWTLKDTVAHLTTWWRREIACAEAVARNERPLDHPSEADVQVINQWVYLTNRDRPLADILRDAEDGWRQFAVALQALSEPSLFEPAQFTKIEGQALGPGLLDSFTRHFYEEHEPLIRAWQAQLDKGANRQ